MDEQKIKFYTLLNDIFEKAASDELIFYPDQSFASDIAGIRQDTYGTEDGKYMYTIHYFRNEPKQIWFTTPQISGRFYA